MAAESGAPSRTTVELQSSERPQHQPRGRASRGGDKGAPSLDAFLNDLADLEMAVKRWNVQQHEIQELEQWRIDIETLASKKWEKERRKTDKSKGEQEQERQELDCSGRAGEDGEARAFPRLKEPVWRKREQGHRGEREMMGEETEVRHQEGVLVSRQSTGSLSPPPAPLEDRRSTPHQRCLSHQRPAEATLPTACSASRPNLVSPGPSSEPTELMSGYLGIQSNVTSSLTPLIPIAASATTSIGNNKALAKLKRFKRRYFVLLSNGTLNVTKTAADPLSKLLATRYLKASSFVSVSETPRPSGKIEFRVGTPDETPWTLEADCERELRAWMAGLREVIMGKVKTNPRKVALERKAKMNDPLIDYEGSETMESESGVVLQETGQQQQKPEDVDATPTTSVHTVSSATPSHLRVQGESEGQEPETGSAATATAATNNTETKAIPVVLVPCPPLHPPPQPLDHAKAFTRATGTKVVDPPIRSSSHRSPVSTFNSFPLPNNATATRSDANPENVLAQGMRFQSQRQLRRQLAVPPTEKPNLEKGSNTLPQAIAR